MKTQKDIAQAAESGSHTHEVFNQSDALENTNLFEEDRALREWLSSYAPAADRLGLSAYGQRCGSAEVIGWGFDANEFKPQFDSHDRFGHRVDQVRFHPAYHQLMDMALSQGIHAMPWDGSTANAHVQRAAYSYMQSQVEAGHGCPLTMTFAAVPTLKLTPSVAEEWLPKVLNRSYEPANKPYFEKQAVTIGMGMTEKQGGSDVRANTSIAKAIGDRGPGELYELTGHKWFMSAPMCDAFLMLAQSEGGLSCFLVPRWRPDGEKNSLFVQRLKNKMGNVSNASSEVEMRGAQGWMVGEEGRGVPAIIEMVALTRFDCMVGSTGGQRQAVAQAAHHASLRKAFGKRLIDQPLMQNVLADLQLEVEGSLAMTMRMAAALDADTPEEKLLLRLGSAVGKFWICKRTPNHAYEAMECLGGNGVIENCIMPRLYREAPINAIWEGSGNIQALDVLRAFAKSPEVCDRWFAELALAEGRSAVLDQHIAALKQELSDLSHAEYRARHLVEQMALCFKSALLLLHGDENVAEAFIASRLERPHSVYGCLPLGCDAAYIVDRILPNRL